MPTPEDQAREIIDQKLTAIRGYIQDNPLKWELDLDNYQIGIMQQKTNHLRTCKNMDHAQNQFR